MDNNNAVNQCITTPTLAISTTTSQVKMTTTFVFRANGRLSPSVVPTVAPSLATASLVAPFPNGTATTAGNLKTLYSRVYTLVGTLPITGSSTVTPTYSWLVSGDYLTTSDLQLLSLAPQPNQSNQTVIGYVIVDNATGSDFVPNTTALSTGSLTVTYVNNYAIIGQ